MPRLKCTTGIIIEAKCKGKASFVTVSPYCQNPGHDLGFDMNIGLHNQHIHDCGCLIYSLHDCGVFIMGCDLHIFFCFFCFAHRFIVVIFFCEYGDMIYCVYDCGNVIGSS